VCRSGLVALGFLSSGAALRLCREWDTWTFPSRLAAAGQLGVGGIMNNGPLNLSVSSTFVNDVIACTKSSLWSFLDAMCTYPVGWLAVTGLVLPAT
jgi:hypothetical protein